MYTSPDIQNEIINIPGNQIRTAIVADCNKSKCFALIFDETIDTSTREQLSVCLRYLVRDPISQEISIKEDFLEFIIVTSTKGEHLTKLLIQTLEGAGINIANMRAQGYDGAANTSGKYNDVQVRICQVVPDDLAIVHSCSDKSIRNVMTTSTVQEVAFSFDYSAKKLQTYVDELESDAATKDKNGKKELNYGLYAKQDGPVVLIHCTHLRHLFQLLYTHLRAYTTKAMTKQGSN